LEQEIRRIHERVDKLKDRIMATCPSVELKQEISELKKELEELHEEYRKAELETRLTAQNLKSETQLTTQKLQSETQSVRDKLHDIQISLDSFKADFGSLRRDFDSFKDLVKPQTDWIAQRRGNEGKVLIALLITALCSLGSSGIWVYIMISKLAVNK